MEEYEEQRKHPRFIVDYPISFLLSNDEIVAATVHDISSGGIQIRCDRITAHKVQHEYESKKEKTSTKFGVNIILPLEYRQEKVEAVCNLVYILRREEDVYAIGMEFIEMAENNRTTLEKFIENSMESM
jgi:c-di-GMP-binding flagellar brake protein YcgR